MDNRRDQGMGAGGASNLADALDAAPPVSVRDDILRRILVESAVHSDAVEPLILLCSEVLRLNQVVNVTGAKDELTLMVKHILDSIRAWECFCAHGSLSSRTRIWDIGSGGGFPGAVIGVMDPSRQVRLVERRERKCLVLDRLVRALGFDSRLKVIRGDFPFSKKFDREDVFWFRGFLPGEKLATFLQSAFPLEDGPQVVLMKGPSWPQELEEILSWKGLSLEWQMRWSAARDLSYECGSFGGVEGGSRKLILL